ncbi:MAG: 4'-phosphopantetheinyl transferase family protein [Acholeplasmataceae bacterium]|jgi:4'-phosphopantetheinyl transferase
MKIGLKKIDKNEYFEDLNQTEVLRILSYRSLKRRRESFSSLRLLKILLNEKGVQEFDIKRDLSGKPYLDNLNIYFNMSHSEEYSTCVISSVEVGIDIEKISSKARNIAKRFLNFEEYKNHQNNEYNDEKLTTLWTIKESYTKLIGRGLTKSFKQLKIVENKDYFEVIDNTENSFAKVFKHDDYIITVCVKNLDELPNEITIY